MAQRVVVQLDCDMDNKSGADVETVAFGYEGTSYELELCSKHRKTLEDALAELAGSARRVTAHKRSTPRSKPARHTDENAEIRRWAAANGIKVSERGRIAADVRAKYHAPDGKSKAVTTPKFKDGTAAL